MIKSEDPEPKVWDIDMASRSDDRDGDKPKDDKPHDDKPNDVQPQGNTHDRDKRDDDDDRKPPSKPVQSGRVWKESASKRHKEKTAKRVAILKKIEESKKSREDYKEDEDMLEVGKLEDEVKEIEADDNSYEPMEGVQMELNERDPDVVPGDGGLLSETEFTTGSAETLGGEAVATAGRWGTVVKFGTQATAMYKFAVGIDGGRNLPDISDKYVDGHRLCSKGVKKGEWEGMGAQIRQIYGVVWDWRGTDDPAEAVRLLDPMVMKAGLLSMKERRKAQAAQKKPDFPERDKVEFWNFPTTYVLTGWRNRTKLTWEQATDYKARVSKDPCIGEGQILRAAQAQLVRYDNTELGKEEAEARHGRLLSKSLSPPPSDAPAATASPTPDPVSAPPSTQTTVANTETPSSSVTPAPAVDADYQAFIQGHLKESCVKLGKTFRSLSPAEKAQMMANARIDYEAQKALDF